MRYRSTFLLLLASLLGTPVLLHSYRAGQRCAAITGQIDAPAFGVLDPAGICRSINPDPLWARFFGIASVAALVAAGIGFARGLAARRHERNLLAGAGVHVSERDLPIEE